jgi:hypothetical protein
MFLLEVVQKTPIFSREALSSNSSKNWQKCACAFGTNTPSIHFGWHGGHKIEDKFGFLTKLNPQKPKRSAHNPTWGFIAPSLNSVKPKTVKPFRQFYEPLCHRYDVTRCVCSEHKFASQDVSQERNRTRTFILETSDSLSSSKWSRIKCTSSVAFVCLFV